MSEIEQIIATLDLKELVKVKKDLDSGGETLNRIVSSKIRDKIRKHGTHCCVCNSRIDPFSVSNFTLVFGPEDMRKKATFCAIDCMEYFLKNLKDWDSSIFVKNRKHQQEQS